MLVGGQTHSQGNSKSDGAYFSMSAVVSAVATLVPGRQDSAAYVCGSNLMERAVQHICVDPILWKELEGRSPHASKSSSSSSCMFGNQKTC